MMLGLLIIAFIPDATTTWPPFWLSAGRAVIGAFAAILGFLALRYTWIIIRLKEECKTYE